MKIFLDTEFTDFTDSELISIGLVTLQGTDAFYGENLDYNPNLSSGFVNHVVVPMLDSKRFGYRYEKLSERLNDWIKHQISKHGSLEIMVDYYQDYRFFIDLLGATYPEITFSMLDQLAYEVVRNTGSVVKDYTISDYLRISEDAYFVKHGIEKYRHHALIDAKAMRHSWIETLAEFTNQSSQ